MTHANYAAVPTDVVFVALYGMIIEFHH